MINLVLKKIGMSHMYDEKGLFIPVTMLYFYHNQIISITSLDERTDIMTIGYKKITSSKRISKSVAGIFKKCSLPNFRYIYSTKIPKDHGYKEGDSLCIDFIKVGSLLEVQGRTIGKGFAGPMKRYHFKGLEASHGVSVSHRSHGSTGQCQDPGKVFKGKKMAGHMGCKNATIKNLKAAFLNKENQILAVSGSVPGSKGNNVFVKVKNV